MSCDQTLDIRNDTATNDHHHEDTGRLGSIFAESLGCHIEDRGPHDGCTETAENQQRRSQRHLHHGTLYDRLRHDRVADQHGSYHQGDSYRSHADDHRAAGYLTANRRTYETADEHEDPVTTGNQACSRKTYFRRQITDQRSGDSYLHADVEEDRNHT